MQTEFNLGVRKLEGGYILDTENGSVIYTSLETVLVEVERLLSAELAKPNLE